MIFDFLKNMAGPPRHERKYIVERFHLFEIEPMIMNNPWGVKRTFSERQINNIYFDSENLTNYFETEAGISRRIKVRLRWYGGLFHHSDNVNLEFKLKENQDSYKVNFALGPFRLNQTCERKWLIRLAQKNQLPSVIIEHLSSLHAVVINTYKRRYFATANKNIRITLDYSIRRYRQYSSYDFRFPRNIILGEKPILEIKYEPSHEDEVRRFIQCFPFRLCKSSKYIQGLEGF